MPNASQITIPKWNFSCSNCGECCRRWHVAISASEKKRLENLDWGEEDDNPKSIFTTINHYEYLAHTRDGCCIFLDPEKNMCKIHAKFGHDAKPKGCRIYPYNIATTFTDQYSVIGRFDCPTIRANAGTPIAKSKNAIRGYIDEMNLKGGYDHYARDDLKEASIKKIVASYFDHLFNKHSCNIVTKMITAVYAANRLEKLGAHFIEDPSAAAIFPSFFKRVIEDVNLMKTKRMGCVEQLRFVNVFISYLRRDEDIIDKGAKARLIRMVAIAKFFYSKGNLRDLGIEHPDHLMSVSRVFKCPISNLEDIDWSLYIDLIKLRLQSFQFFGPTHYDLSFFIGMKSLFFSFPLVVATAKWSALARDQNQCAILPNDVDYAVGVIDHNLGRSALIGSGIYTIMIRQMTEVDAFSKLTRAMLF